MMRNKEFQDLKNYQRIHELDFFVRQIYKQNLITPIIKKIISEYIKYDEKIESNCEDCNQLLLKDDIRKCRGKVLMAGGEWNNGHQFIRNRVPKICNKKCCNKCLVYNIYRPIAKTKERKFKYLLAYQCCKGCYKINNNQCDICHFKMDVTCKLQKCNLCDKRICVSCDTFTKYYYNTPESIHKGEGVYETFDKIRYHSKYCTKCNNFKCFNDREKYINVLVNIKRKR